MSGDIITIQDALEYIKFEADMNTNCYLKGLQPRFVLICAFLIGCIFSLLGSTTQIYTLLSILGLLIGSGLLITNIYGGHISNQRISYLRSIALDIIEGKLKTPEAVIKRYRKLCKTPKAFKGTYEVPKQSRN